MKAVVIHGAHDLRIEDVEVGEIGPGQIRIDIAAGGICGSDLHYFNHGGIGAIRVREPMILGHEVSGYITELGEGTQGFKIGDLVAISPSRPCKACKFCDEGIFNQCLNMRFYGSAMPMPHIQGAFRESLIAEVEQCHLIADGIPASIAAFAEPLSVVLHGLRRGGDVSGKRVLITGCGPIGALCVMACKAAGAAEVVVTDILDEVLDVAQQIGADRTINVVQTPNWVSEFNNNKGTFDVMFEASGTEAAMRAGLEVIKPRAILVQLGLGGDVTLPQNTIVSKEIDIRGAFRFHEEFAASVEMINSLKLDPSPLLSANFSLSAAEDAFNLASDRRRAMKVQLDFKA